MPSTPKSKANEKVPSLEGVIESILGQWGGAAQFARAFRDTYDKAKPGTMIRSRMLEKMLDFMRMYAQLHGDQDDLDGLSEAELSLLVQELGSEQGRPAKQSAQDKEGPVGDSTGGELPATGDVE